MDDLIELLKEAEVDLLLLWQ